MAVHVEGVVTVLIAELADNEMRIVNCGHPSPFVFRSTRWHRTDIPPSTPIGMHDTDVVHRLPLLYGDRVLFHTDGLIEARDPSGAFIPVEWLLGPAAREREPHRAADAVVAYLARLTRDEFTDDVALLVLDIGAVRVIGDTSPQPESPSCTLRLPDLLDREVSEPARVRT